MKKQFDVIALGELLIDFTVNGKSERGNNVFEANPGGAPCNVLAILEKLGKKLRLSGKWVTISLDIYLGRRLKRLELMPRT